MIGQVIKIQFKEPRPTNEFDALMEKRGQIVTAIETSFREKNIPFDAWGQKMGDNYENVFSFKNTEIQTLLNKPSLILSDLSTLFPLETIALGKKEFSGKVA